MPVELFDVSGLSSTTSSSSEFDNVFSSRKYLEQSDLRLIPIQSVPSHRLLSSELLLFLWNDTFDNSTVGLQWRNIIENQVEVDQFTHSVPCSLQRLVCTWEALLRQVCAWRTAFIAYFLWLTLRITSQWSAEHSKNLVHDLRNALTCKRQRRRDRHLLPDARKWVVLSILHTRVPWKNLKEKKRSWWKLRAKTDGHEKKVSMGFQPLVGECLFL